MLQLMLVHQTLTGRAPGRRHKVEVLNKSAILFLCASFEAFIEDLAGGAFDYIVDNSPAPAALPIPIKKSIAEALKCHKNDLKVWDLAGDGWKSVAASHKRRVVDRHIGRFNTPKYGNISDLLRDLIGFGKAEKCFTWTRMKSTESKERLRKFVELRGALAHGEKPAPKVQKADVTRYLLFLAPLSVRLSNEVRAYVETCVGSPPWDVAAYNKIK
ncbi:HEPN domain-containing protein [Thioalkalivibrio thiocyanodenitrificans]|uniref:HEPN domain-containing protein n=1 Tax=Thioalkalivibrio thiocyanodenitrificans TaxID=243063 RepID=UPI0018DDCCEE|nr:HEPN domain-containing protein [Thioalkalivibrio thiocyanodenitrificans]